MKWKSDNRELSKSVVINAEKTDIYKDKQFYRNLFIIL